MGRGGGVTLTKTPGQKGLAAVRAGIELRKWRADLRGVVEQKIAANPTAHAQPSINLRLVDKNDKLVANDDAIGPMNLLGAHPVKPI